MLELKSLEVDPTLAEEGVWANFAGGKFLLARAGHAYKSRVSELVIKDWDLINSNTPEGEQRALDIYTQAAAEFILLDWKDVGSDGEELRYTSELGAKLLGDPRYNDLREFIDNFTSNRANYRGHVESEVVASVKGTAVS